MIINNLELIPKIKKMTRAKRPTINEEKLKNNPLVKEDFQIIINKMIDEKSFKREEDILVHNDYQMEKETVTKIYTNPLYRRHISSLSSRAKSLFLWIMYEIESGKDFIWINKSRYMEENNLSSINTYKESIIDLTVPNIICPTIYPDVYWINPRYFFSGNRMTKYKDHLILYKPHNKNR